MNTNLKKQKDFFTKGWYIYALWKLGLADDKDIPSTMWTKIQIQIIESKIVAEVRRGTSELLVKAEHDLFWGDGSLEREPEKKE